MHDSFEIYCCIKVFFTLATYQLNLYGKMEEMRTIYLQNYDEKSLPFPTLFVIDDPQASYMQLDLQ